MTIFWVFKKPLHKNQKRFFLFKLLHQKEISRENLGTKTKAVLWKLWGNSRQTQSCFFENGQKNPCILGLFWCNQQSLSIVLKTVLFFLKSNHLGIFGEIFIQFSWVSRTALQSFFPWMIIGVTRCTLFHLYLNIK